MTRKLVYRPAHSENAEQTAREQDQEQPRKQHESQPVSAPPGVLRQASATVDAHPADVGRGLYRPVKQRVTIRLDADVIEWFKAQASSKGQGRGYQTLINRALREFMQRD